jgi:hypothetical protein
MLERFLVFFLVDRVQRRVQACPPVKRIFFETVAEGDHVSMVEIRTPYGIAGDF